MEERQRKRQRVDNNEEEGAETFWINSLDAELLIFIFSFITPLFPNLVQLSLVCRLWNGVISQPSALWSSLHFTGKRK